MAWIFGAIEPLAKCVPSARYCFGFGKGHLVEPLLLGLAKVDGNLFHCRGDEEQIRRSPVPSKLEAKSLSITAAVPRYSPLPVSTTGIPPPPTVMVMMPAFEQ